MKICPKCRSKFTDDSLNFCLQDGAPLDEVIEHKTIAFDADSFANEATITENVPRDNIADKTEELPNNVRAKDTDRNRSVETVVSNAQTENTTFDTGKVVKKGTGVGFVAGVLLSLFLIGVVVGGIYLASNYSSFVAGSTNSNTNISTAPKTRVLSDSPNVKVSASSTRKPDKGNIYSPEMAFDGNPRTAWCEGVRGAGKKQWLAFDFKKEEKLKSIVVQAGYFKTPEIWRKNNRIASVTIEFSDNSKRSFNFADVMKEQTLEVGGLKTKTVFIAITDIFRGEADVEDTLISEVSFVVE